MREQFAIRVTNKDGTFGYWGPESTARPYNCYSTAHSAARRRFPLKTWKVVRCDCSGRPVATNRGK